MGSVIAAAVLKSASRIAKPILYWDDILARRLRPETLDREAALEKAKTLPERQAQSNEESKCYPAPLAC